MTGSTLTHAHAYTHVHTRTQTHTHTHRHTHTAVTATVKQQNNIRKYSSSIDPEIGGEEMTTHASDRAMRPTDKREIKNVAYTTTSFA